MQLHQHSISETISKRYFQEIDNINQYAGIEDFFVLESKLIFEVYHLEAYKSEKDRCTKLLIFYLYVLVNK